MDTTTYEQHTLDAEAVGDQADWLSGDAHPGGVAQRPPGGHRAASVVELTVMQTFLW